MDRPDISRLQKNRDIYFKLGFITALSFVIFAFSWTTQVPNQHIVVTEDLLSPKEIQVIRTAQEKPKPVPPPPIIKPSDKIIEQDEEFIEEPLPKLVTTIEVSPTEELEPIPIPTETSTPKPKIELMEEIEPEAEKIFVVVEEMPRFPGCEESGLPKIEKKYCAESKMLQFLSSHLRYPSMALENRITGTAVVSFVVEKDGSISNIEIVKEIGGGCGKEAARVVNKMPGWIPGKQRGKAVRVKYNLPVKFNLR